MNAAIYKEELDKLEAERTAGTVDADSYEQSHAEMRQRLFQDTDEADDLALDLLAHYVFPPAGFFMYKLPLETNDVG